MVFHQKIIDEYPTTRSVYTAAALHLRRQQEKRTRAPGQCLTWLGVSGLLAGARSADLERACAL